MSKVLTSGESQKIKAAIKKLTEAAQELANAVDEIGYELSDASPDYLTDVDDFTYDLISWSEDEFEEIDEQTEELVHTA